MIVATITKRALRYADFGTDLAQVQRLAGPVREVVLEAQHYPRPLDATKARRCRLSGGEATDHGMNQVFLEGPCRRRTSQDFRVGLGQTAGGRVERPHAGHEPAPARSRLACAASSRPGEARR